MSIAGSRISARVQPGTRADRERKNGKAGYDGKEKIYTGKDAELQAGSFL